MFRLLNQFQLTPNHLSYERALAPVMFDEYLFEFCILKEILCSIKPDRIPNFFVCTPVQ